jgi:hypothetical protein
MIKNFFSKSSLILIIIGSIIVSCTMIRSGIIYNFGMGFWGPNAHDGLWHISLINQIKQQIPPANPVFSKTILSNYHWGFDLFLALLSKVFLINPITLYFQIIPLVFSTLLGILSYTLAQKIYKNKKISFYFVFLNYFAGSLGFLVTYFKSQTIGGESLFWSMQSISTLINPPYALSLIILIIGLIIWQNIYKKNVIIEHLILGIFLGLLTAIKVYSALLIGFSLTVFYLYSFYKEKKINKSSITLLATTAIFSYIILKIFGVSSQNSFLEYKPFWFTHSLIESVDKLYIPRLATLLQNLSENPFTYKFPFYIGLEISLVFVFIIGNFGTRLLGLSKIINNKLLDIEKLLLILIAIGIILPLLFVQKGTAWNTIQFMYYSLLFSNLFFAKFLSSLKNKFLIFIILIFTTITSYSTLKDYFGNPPPTAIPPPQLEALKYLSKLSDDIILSYPYDQFKKNNLKTPIVINLYETTAYVSAMTGKTSYLEDEMNLDITRYNWQDRKKEALDFFNSNNKYQARGFLINNDIDYIYLVDDQNIKLNTDDLQIDKIFENSSTKIYKVQK